MGVGQLQPKRDPDIARSDCPVPHLGQRCRLPPVNVPADSVRDSRALVALQPPGVTQESILWRGASSRHNSVSAVGLFFCLC